MYLILILTQGLPPVLKTIEDDIKVETIQDLILYHYHIKKRNSLIFKTLHKPQHVQKEK